jgi:hypothetical protein
MSFLLVLVNAIKQGLLLWSDLACDERRVELVCNDGWRG